MLCILLSCMTKPNYIILMRDIFKSCFNVPCRRDMVLNLTCLFLVSGEESVQKAFHSQQRGDPHSCANGRWLTQIQDHSGQREVGAWEQRDCLVNQVFPCEQKAWLMTIIHTVTNDYVILHLVSGLQFAYFLRLTQYFCICYLCSGNTNFMVLLLFLSETMLSC